jgi:hypothetical protein
MLFYMNLTVGQAVFPARFPRRAVGLFYARHYRQSATTGPARD